MTWLGHESVYIYRYLKIFSTSRLLEDVSKPRGLQRVAPLWLSFQI